MDALIEQGPFFFERIRSNTTGVRNFHRELHQARSRWMPRNQPIHYIRQGRKGIGGYSFPGFISTANRITAVQPRPEPRGPPLDWVGVSRLTRSALIPDQRL